MPPIDITKAEALSLMQKWKTEGTKLEILFDLTDEFWCLDVYKWIP